MRNDLLRSHIGDVWRGVPGLGELVLGEKEPNNVYFKKCDLTCLFIGLEISGAFVAAKVSLLRRSLKSKKPRWLRHGKPEGMQRVDVSSPRRRVSQ